jgi:4,5-dihydroxyphthalate decarboxylase
VTTENIEVQFNRMRYDMMLPLMEGRVDIPGVSLKIGRGGGGNPTSDDSPFRLGEFGVSDLNMGYLPRILEKGWEVVALPTPSKRKPVLQFIWVRNDRGINSPKDLEGKLITARAYTSAITVFARGLLQHFYDVDISKLRWKVNDREEYFPFYGNVDLSYYDAGDNKGAVQRLLAGEVDAIISDVSDRKAWETLAKSSEIRLLFPNYEEEDYKIFQETGVYTPVHMLIMSRKLDEAHPELARKLYDGLDQAKTMSIDDALNDRAGFSVLYQREITFAQMDKWGDPFAYGMKANKNAFDMYFTYCHEQGITKDALTNEDVFAGSTLDT